MYMFRHHMQHWMRHRKLIIIALFQQHLFKALQLNQRQWICSHAQQLTIHSLNQWRSQRSSPDSNRFSRLHIQTIMNKRMRPTLNTNILHFLFSSNQLTQFNNPIKYNESRVQRASPFAGVWGVPRKSFFLRRRGKKINTLDWTIKTVLSCIYEYCSP